MAGEPAAPEPRLYVERVRARDGACADVMFVEPVLATHAVLVWLPALGVAARHYLPFAHALAAKGVAVALHEWRGMGSSDRRASRRCTWGYRELLLEDVPATRACVSARHPGVPTRIGGHSLGGQIAVLSAALSPDPIERIDLVASGAPYWRTFDAAWALRATFALVPWIGALVGYFPGRALGFGGREARGVIDDWARTGRTGRYAARGIDADLEARLADLTAPVRAVRLADDRLVPEASLEWLLGRFRPSARETSVLGSNDLGTRADHFAWLKVPRAVVDTIA
jgi:predicted alpha/beta hydrolase